ncbi:hypothetical protein ACHWQZ_G013724 [Mnemiopsis leidyi]
MDPLYNDDDGEHRIRVLFNDPIHKEEIVGNKNIITQIEETKVRTNGAVIIIISMIGIIPPEKQRITPCAVKETWVDPTQLDLTKAKNRIKENLKRQFTSILPQAQKKISRYNDRDRGPIRVEMDCAPNKVFSACDQVRKNVGKASRVIFYYNGHGAMSCAHPSSENGRSIWVVNEPDKKRYIKFETPSILYTVVSLTNLMERLEAPALYIWDCDNAGLIVQRFNEIAREKKEIWKNAGRDTPEPRFEEECLHLAACSKDQVLPQNPEMPADMYTSCLTSTVKTALHYWFHQQKITNIHIIDCIEYLDNIPGKYSARSTMAGELDWVLTAVLDTLAWQIEPDYDRFKELFRNCKPVGLLFRGHILADRVMRAYNVAPVTHPRLPSLAGHPLWRSWDLALDSIMTELSLRKIRPSRPALHGQISTFFFDQLTEFKVNLTQYGKHDKVDSRQLPVLLQMLMSAQYRTETLELVGKFLDRGPYAVQKFLDVGILPYIRQLLTTPSRDYKYIMVLIWAKILATDRRHSTADVVLNQPECRRFFVNMLNDPDMRLQTRAMSCFCLSILAKNSQKNQEILLGENLIKELDDCLMDMSSPNKSSKLQNCAVLCLANLWDRNEKALWASVRANTIDNHVIKLLDHPHPETRTSAVYALGTFLNTRRKESDHGESIEHRIASNLLKTCGDGSPLVRKEVVVALSRYVQQYEQRFQSAAVTVNEEVMTIRQRVSICEDEESVSTSPSLNKKLALKNTLLSPQSRLTSGNKFVETWKCLKGLEKDPHQEVRELASKVVFYIEKNIPKLHNSRKSSETAIGSDSSPESRSSPGSNLSNLGLMGPTSPIVYHYSQYSSKRTIFGKGPKFEEFEEERPPTHPEESPAQIVKTEFPDWCEASFAKPLLSKGQESDPNSELFVHNQIRDRKHAEKKRKARAELEKRGHEKIEAQIFGIKHNSRPHRVNFHPFEPYIYVVDDTYCSILDFECSQTVHKFECCGRRGSARDAILLNPHKKPFLCVVNNEAEVFVWRAFEDPQTFSLATAFKAFAEGVNKKIPMILNYGEFTSNLFVTGQLKRIVSWNLFKETRYPDIQTMTEMPLTAMTVFDRTTPDSGDQQENLLLAGFYDGVCKLFDLRNPTHSQIVQRFGESVRSKSTSVVNVHIKPNNDNKIIYTAHSSGDMCFWDLRKSRCGGGQSRYQPLAHEAPKTLSVVNNNLKTVAFHNYAPVMACGCYDQGIRIWNIWGDKLNDIKFHEGFMGQRVGPSISLAFHPFEYKLVSAGLDNCVTVYGKSTQPQSLRY